jgi:hypothetical protein
MPMTPSMPINLADPTLIAGLAAGTLGAVLLVHARTQSRLLRRRIVTGEGTAVIDATTGMFSPEAADQCVRAEANRAYRLGRELDVWLATADDAASLEAAAHALVFDLPAGALSVRLSDRELCVVSCAHVAAPTQSADGLQWRSASFTPNEDVERKVRTFLTQASGAHG